MPNVVTPYVPTNWQDLPIKMTPIDSTNLNHLEQGVKIVTDYLNSGGGGYTPTPATSTELGCIKVGSGLSITQDGILSASAPSITVDDQMSLTSVNPVQNKIISQTFQANQSITFLTTDTVDTSPGNGSTFPFLDGTTKKRIRWDNIVSTLKLYFDTVYNKYVLPNASASQLGGIKVGTNLTIDANGVLSAVSGSYTPTPATDTNLGCIKVGSGLSITQDGTLSSDGGSYVLPTASENVLGGIKVGTNLTIDSNGVLSAVSGSYTPTPATDTNLGCIKVGSGLSITQDGTLSATGGGGITVDDQLSTTSTNPVQNKVITTEINKTFRTSDSEMSNVSSDDDTFPVYSQGFHSQQKVKWSRIKSQLKTYFDNYYNKYTLPKASASTLGGIKIGSNLSIDSDGILSADAQQYILPTASTSTLGGVKIDGSTITIDQNGVISSSGGGGTIEYATSEQIIALFNDGTDVYLNGDSTSVTF